MIAEVFEQVLEIPSVSRTDDFFELGGDSLKAVEACLELDRVTGFNRAFGAIQHASSIAEFAQILGGAVDRGCLVPLQQLGQGPPLFCVHAHMGHVFNLRQLASQFAPEQKFFGLQAKGLDGIERPEIKLEDMAASYVANMRIAQPEGPYLIAGYCFGSWVAIEIARKLRDTGQQVAALFLIDPQLPKGISPEGLRGHFGPRTGRLIERLRRITLRRTVWALRNRLAQATRAVRVRLLWLVAHLLPATHWLSEIALRRPADTIAIIQLDYRPRPYDGDAYLLIPADKLPEPHHYKVWESIIEGRIEFETLVGTASELMREPFTRDLAACLLGHINQLSVSEPGTRNRQSIPPNQLE
jgi:thioesterase domain-containing protein